MKLHPSLLSAVTDTIHLIFTTKRWQIRPSSKVLRSNKKWGSRDRAFIAENCYEMVRWWRMLHLSMKPG
ncbi:MAG: hypothetical protein IPH36_16780 [Saprospiraceae bacterium]|nr:hypothetical protein [Saprospiraceae bacterium]